MARPGKGPYSCTATTATATEVIIALKSQPNPIMQKRNYMR